MRWLSDRFIQTAQSSSLAGDIPKEKIPEVLRLVATGKDAVLRLLTNKNEVIEITECEFPMYMRKARTYLQENAPEYRDSIISSLTASSTSSGAHSVFSDRSRASIASTNTSASIFSTGTQSDITKRSVTVPTSFAKTLGKPHICPTCGKEFKHPWDLAKHVRAFHERETTVFQCWYCEQTSEDRSVIERHCRRAHPAHFPSVHVLPSFNKVSYGCSFCETPSSSLDAYLKCMEDDQKKHPALLPIPTKRLRALLRQSEVTLLAIEQACEGRQLHRHAWKQFTWNDSTCDEYSRRLEYGCNGHDDIHRPGVDNIHQFIEQLLATATFESTGRPIPPRKDATGAAGNIAPTDNAPALNTTPVNPLARPRYHRSFPKSPVSNTRVPNPQNQYNFNPSNMPPDDATMYHARTVSGIEDAARQSNNQAPLMLKTMPPATGAPQKRHPSVDSTSHPENSSRAKRHPAADKLALSAWNTDRPDSTVLPAETLPSLRPNIGPGVPTHPAATTERDEEATETLDPVSDFIEMYDRKRESVALNGVEFGNGYSFEGLENQQGYSDQPWDGDQNLFWVQQNFGTQYDALQYYNNDQQPHDNQQTYNNNRNFNTRHYNQRYYN